MRAIIYRFDGWLSKRNGITLLPQREGCILRIQLTQASHPVEISDFQVKKGDLILALHLWNERIPSMPPSGPDIAWARRVQRMFIHSLQIVAAEMQIDPCLAGARAVEGESMLLSLTGGEHLMHRLGFVIMPSRNRLGRFGEFWENFYSWWLMWAYNPASLRNRHLSSLKREELWMPSAEFIRRFGVNIENKEIIQSGLKAAETVG